MTAKTGDAGVQVRDVRDKGTFWGYTDLIWRDGKALGAYGIAVYCALATHADYHSQTCYPSHQKLADEVGCSRRQVMRALALLEEVGWISIDRQPHKSHTYTLLPNPYASGRCDSQSHLDRGGVTHSHIGVTHSHTRCDSQSHKQESYNKNHTTRMAADDLTNGQESSYRILTAFGVDNTMARKLAASADPKLVSAWADATRRKRGLKNPAGFLVAKLRSGEPPPAAKKLPKEDPDRYIGGAYAEFVEH